MKILRTLFVLIVVISLCAPAFGEESEKLLKIAALSRHGVRAPTQSHKLLQSWTLKTWPVWPVKKGDLTPRGARLARAMWHDLREILNKEGLFQENMCPTAGAVYVRADTDERTKATAHALLQGLAPNCSIGYAVAPGEIDPLFHPVKAGLYRYNPTIVARDILAMADGSLQNTQEALSESVNLAGDILGSPSEEVCERFVMAPKCRLGDLPSAVSVHGDGKGAHIIGALGIASSVAEIFLLEYGEWPDVNAGWGEVNDKVLSEILPAHAKVFDLVNRAPVVAWAQGSSLLKEIGDALMNKHYDKRANEAKFVVFVGHDTNIANIGGLMGIQWQAKGYPQNGIPPASVIFFELWEKGGKKEIRVKYYAQPPKELHAPFYDEKNSGGAAHSHSPSSGRVSVGPEYIGATYDESEFANRIRAVTKDAPIAPSILPEMEYGMPIASE